MKTLLQKFNISSFTDTENWNLVGIDFGDGEISVSQVSFDPINKMTEIQPLKLDKARTLDKNPNVFFFGNNESKLITEVAEEERDTGVRYYNYKKCPGDAAAINSLFRKDDGESANMTYSSVMASAFGELVETLFTCNPFSLSKKKKTIILVGRPSGTGWASCEVEYAQLLQSGLKLSPGQEPVYVAVQSESTAALAREIDPKWDINRVKRNEIVVVLDNGSSTFDITVITPDGVVGEDSYQFGGNVLDANMMILLESQINKNHPGMMLNTKHGHKLQLRIKKERYYGLRGRSRDPQVYSYDLVSRGNAGKKVRAKLEIDDDAMHTVLHDIPVKIRHLETGINGLTRSSRPIPAKSWIDACKYVYQDFYDKMRCHFRKEGADSNHPFVPDRIILSGGVSVMPEVQEVITSVFGIRPILTERPNYSVSEGLAYVLGTEVQKMQKLQFLIAQLDTLLPSAATLRESCGDAGEDEEWAAYKGAISEWAQLPGDVTALKCHEIWAQKYYNLSLNGSIQHGAERWYEDYKIQHKLDEYLQNDFNDLFKDYQGKFVASLPDVKFTSLAGVNIAFGMPYAFFFGVENINPDTPMNNGERISAYKHFISIENKVRKGGVISFTHTVPVEKGLIFKRTEYETRVHKISYEGIRHFYLKHDAISLDFAQKTRSDIIEMIIPLLEEHVERMTPYFNMTARQTISSKA